MAESDVRLAWRLFNLNWAPIALMAGTLLLAVLLTDFSIEFVAFGAMSGLAAQLALMVYLYFLVRGNLADPKLVFSVGALAQLVFIVTIMGPLTYVAAAINWPLQDHTFLAIDRALGMDPEVIARFVNDHQWINRCLETGYGIIKWPLIAIPILLAATLRLMRLQLFTAAFSLTLTFTIVISAFAPAIGTYYGLNVSPTEFPTLNTSIYTAQLRDILALRAGSLRHLELFQLSGVVSFPSFHAASAVLYMWALWPMRGLRTFAVLSNALMLAATPVVGAHYAIDVIGGALLAAICIMIAKYCLALAASRPPLEAPVQISYGRPALHGANRWSGRVLWPMPRDEAS